ncbi:MAG: cytochrome c biogenesis protein CcsA [Deltaproteobacteria bacterium]|nr:cytochrome c biogenesis protein CcsA [Deltaproteobacteria bacterium]MBN2671489.1 cytochrome c biogenesis protein CcsA [Deltaproteobacteria bacterium]
MTSKLKIFEPILALAVIAFSLWMVFFHTPVEQQMGIVQKIFYFHVPSAYSMYLAWTVCTVASILYIIKNTEKFDVLAKSSAEVALVYAVMVMTTGPLWGRKSWGAFWAWDPRLTSALVLTLIIVSYVILRHMSKSDVIKKFSAALSIVGAAMIPLVHISVYKWRGQHPSVFKNGGLSGEMLRTLMICMASFTIVFIVFLRKRYALEAQHRKFAELKQRAFIKSALSDE